MTYEALNSPFQVDVLDVNDNKLGEGPLRAVFQLNNTARLDVIGGVEFSLPASDPRTALIQAGVQFDIKVQDDPNTSPRSLGKYSYRGKSLSDAGQKGMLNVRADDALIELTRRSVNFRRVYDNVDVGTVVSDLVSVVPGWTADPDAGMGNTQFSLEGESPFIAVDHLRDRWNKHFRLSLDVSGDNILEFGSFGVASGIRLVSLRGQEQASFAVTPDIAVIDRITLVEEAEQIFNSIIPLGAGQGVSQITIAKASAAAGDYAIQTGANEDTSPFYYIQDAASVALYDERWRVLTFPQFRPITSSDADFIRAASGLKLAAEAYLARHLVPRVTYSVEVRGLRQGIQPGDTVRLDYQGAVDGYSYINVNEDFYVMDVTYKRNANGQRSASMNISTLAVRRTSDTDIVLGVMNDLNALKVHVPVTQTYAKEGPYNGLRIDSATDAEVIVRIKEEVTSMSRALLRFKSSPLRSSVTAAASGGGSTSSGSGDHRHLFLEVDAAQSDIACDKRYKCKKADDSTMTIVVGQGSHGLEDLYTQASSGDHTHTISAHTHTLTYGIFEDTVYPANIRISINGVDRTIALGGPWGSAGVAADVEVDITAYLTEPIATLQQNHEIVFSCDSSQGELTAGVDMLVAIQAIAIG